MHSFIGSTAYPAFMEMWLKMKLQHLEKKVNDMESIQVMRLKMHLFPLIFQSESELVQLAKQGFNCHTSLRAERALLSANVF